MQLIFSILLSFALGAYLGNQKQEVVRTPIVRMRRTTFKKKPQPVSKTSMTQAEKMTVKGLDAFNFKDRDGKVVFRCWALNEASATKKFKKYIQARKASLSQSNAPHYDVPDHQRL